MLKFQDMDLRIEYKAKLSGDELKITRKVADVARRRRRQTHQLDVAHALVRAVETRLDT